MQVATSTRHMALELFEVLQSPADLFLPTGAYIDEHLTGAIVIEEDTGILVSEPMIGAVTFESDTGAIAPDPDSVGVRVLNDEDE